MRKLLFAILFACAFATSVKNQADAVKGLISRVLGEVRHSTHFLIRIMISVIYRGMLTISTSKLLKKKTLTETIGLLVRARMMDIFLSKEQQELQFRMLFTCELRLPFDFSILIIDY